MQPLPAEPAAEPALIELRDVAVSSLELPHRAILDGVNWAIRPEDFWIIGALPNSGKTDLLATAAGLRRPLRGCHRLFGRETTGFQAEEALRDRLRVGIVFADGGRVFQQLTVAANVALPLSYHRDCSLAQVQEQVAAVLDFVGLTALALQPAGRVGRAWQQRVALARALVLRPEVLLLDNPLAGVDPRQAAWWLGFLEQVSTGHKFFEGRRLSLAVATDDLRPWLSQGRQFACLQDNHWRPIGSRAELAGCGEPLVQELMATPLANH